MRISKTQLKYIRSLSHKKAREAERRFTLEGWRALKEAIASSATMDLVAVLPRFLADPDYAKILRQLEERRIPVREISDAELRLVADTVHAQGVLAVVHRPEPIVSDERLNRASLVVALDAVADPGNVGSIVRSADWFGVDLVLLGKGSVELFNEKVIRSTVGSVFHVPVVSGVDLSSTLRRMKQGGFFVMGLSGDAKRAYTDVAGRARMVILLGSEGHGLSKEVRASADVIVQIPRFGKAESLNVSVACGIVLSHFRTKNR
ncbi:MAG: RNA methyltransferase [Ignavibacteria bacterium]|nr:RNA methyltransferase [Ignavibacteria bacterium]